MNIEEVQKINNLARELMRYGQASSMEEALRLAQSQLANGSDGTHLKETSVLDAQNKTESSDQNKTEQTTSEVIAPVAQEPAEIPKPVEVVPKETSVSTVSEKGDNEVIKRLIQITNVHTTHIKELHEKLNSLLQEVAKFREQTKKFASSPVMVPSEQASSKTPVKEPQTTFKPQPVEEKKASPRSGTYKSEDVAIDKFFYCGGK